MKSAEKLARATKWETIETDQVALWGTIYGSGKKPYLARINLKTTEAGEFKFKCTCPSRKQPCKHVLALLMVAISEQDKVREGSAPDWVQEWMEAAEARASKQKAAKPKPAAPKNKESAAKSAAGRREKIGAGLDELELWLINLLKGGLSDPVVQTYEFWERRAARLVDAQAPGLATVLRNLAGIHVRHKNWIDLMTAELGRLYLIIRAFRNFDNLNKGQQADLRTALGWAVKRDEFENQPPIEDEWLTIARYERNLSNQLREQRIWLMGKQSAQAALLLEFAYGDRPFETGLPVGTAASGKLLFYPSATTLRAVPAQPLTLLPAPTFEPERSTIEPNLDRYAALLAANPWQTEHLITIEASCRKLKMEWWAVDKTGAALPLSHELKNRWQLLALTGGQPVMLSGLWDGSTLIPLAALAKNRWVDLQLAGGDL